MKKRCLLSILMAVMFVCFSGISAQAVLVNLNLLDSYITVGQDFDVEVWVDYDGLGNLGNSNVDGLELTGFGFDVSLLFPTDTYFEFSGHTFLDPSFFDLSFGTNNVTASLFPPSTYDDILLATLQFKALGEGNDGSISVFGAASPMSGLHYLDVAGVEHIYEISADENITVNATPIPEPATMLFLGVGIIGGCALRRKKIV